MKVFSCVAVMFVCFSAMAVQVSDGLLNKIAYVESKNNDKAVGDKGKAIGRFQIWKTYVDETNRICKLKKNGKIFTYNDRYSGKKSREMVKIYLEFWGSRYEKATGKKADDAVLAKIHNGHAFWTKTRMKDLKFQKRLDSYWNKVKSAL